MKGSGPGSGKEHYLKKFDELKFEKQKIVAGRELPNGTVDYGWVIEKITDKGRIVLKKGLERVNLTNRAISEIESERPINSK